MFKSAMDYRRTLGLSGLFFAAKARMLNTTVSLKVKRHDVKFPFILRVPSSDFYVYRMVFTNQEYDFLVDPPPEVIVDAGANIGLASIYFANRFPEAKIIAIEPAVSNFEVLKKNVAPYPGIIPIQAALWNKNAEIDLVDPGLGHWAYMTEEHDSSGDSLADVRHKVTALTVDQIIDDFQLDRIDILKIDIEGAEKEVFRDTSGWIHKVDALIIELHERYKPGCSRSFYNGSNGFDNEGRQGENVYLSRGGRLATRW